MSASSGHGGRAFGWTSGKKSAPPARRGDWMQTFTGRAFWPLDPRPEEVHVEDIAHALSMLCRYAGHVRSFYSVAEHCVLMSLAVSPENALAALLHDATEAYVVDVPRPLKRSLPEYVVAEARVAAAITSRLGVDISTLPAEVKEADNRILLNERDALMATPPLSWGFEDLTPLPVAVTGWAPDVAEAAWLSRFHHLSKGSP